MKANKDETITIRLTTAIKKLIVRRASASRRSVANYLALIAEEDARRQDER
jgi:uncharacterized protein (DUF1778 family)